MQVAQRLVCSTIGKVSRLSNHKRSRSTKNLTKGITELVDMVYMIAYLLNSGWLSSLHFVRWTLPPYFDK